MSAHGSPASYSPFVLCVCVCVCVCVCFFFSCAPGIIASKRCNNVKIHDNEVWGGGESAAGIFLHRSSDDAEVYSESRVPLACVSAVRGGG